MLLRRKQPSMTGVSTMKPQLMTPGVHLLLPQAMRLLPMTHGLQMHPLTATSLANVKVARAGNVTSKKRTTP
jgi:hypothetical protein